MAEWKDLCRGCLGSGPQVSFFDGDDEIRLKFHESTSIEVTENDTLPTNLCLDCLDVLNTAHEFRKQCIRNDAELRGRLSDAEKCELNSVDQEANSYIDDLNKLLDPMLFGDHSESVQPIKLETNSQDIGDLTGDEDVYYVLVIDDDNKNSSDEADINDEFIKRVIKMEPNESDLHLDHKRIELPDDPADMHEDNEHPIATDDDDFDVEKQLSLLHEAEAMDEDSQDNTTTITPDISAFVQAAADGMMEDMDPNDEATNKLIQIFSEANAEVQDIITNEDGTSVTYVTAQQPGEDDDMQEEIMVCEGDESYGIINYDGTELVIEYADGSQMATVIEQEDGTYICECGVQLQDLIEYEKHQFTHGLFSCPICGKCYESQEIVAGHILLHSNNDASVPCPFCQQVIKRNYLTQHIKVTHNEIRPQCAVCQKTFANDNNLKRHMLIHQGVKDFACDVCHKRFNQKITMQTHRLTHETVDIQTCNICRRFFDSKDALNTHLATHDSEDNKAAENISDGPQVSNGNLLVKFSCPECPKKYGTAVALNFHMESIHGSDKGELLCSECGEVLPNKRAMFAHSISHKQPKSKHSRRFICGTCNKQCASHAMLIMHERVHTNERPFACEHCPLRFKTKTHLRTHQLTHTREKKFGCSVCMKFFALKGNLVVHLRTHTGERPYVCTLCGEAFIDSKYLKKHKMKKHAIINLPWNRYS